MATPSRDSTTHRAAISRSSSTYARKRATKACQVCRARRTKCDQKRPSCSFCARAGVECVFEPDDNATFDQASLAIIDRLDRLERKIDAQTLAGETRDDNPTNSNDNGLIKPSSPTLSREQLFPVTLGGVLKWPVFQDVTSPIATTNSPDSTRSHSRTANQQTAWLGDVLHRSACDRWLENFFAHVHVKNPILKETETRRLVSRLCVQGPDWDVASGLALLVCANGAIARPLHEALPLSNPDVQAAITLFDAAQRRLGADLTSMGLIRAQCAFFSGVLLMSLLRPVEAWTTFVHGLAI
ncbi:Zcf27p [Fusarium torreyae]|uniref:Zcf27p n=1 Tax=Fusarium torreyae TaxID=1237075 RepID=A0A9W8S836_9HYPO|nr:Zcf27p [Fusarium torreyae]